MDIETKNWFGIELWKVILFLIIISSCYLIKFITLDFKIIISKI